MELCGGTHTRATGEIGLFRILGENAVAAGTRRIEAVAGLEAYRESIEDAALIRSLAGKLNSPLLELEKKLESLLQQQKDLERALKASQQRDAANTAAQLRGHVETLNGIPCIIRNMGTVDADGLQLVVDALKTGFQGVILLGGSYQGSVGLVAAVTPEFVGKVQAGKLVQAVAPIVGGKGGGRPDNARGGGKDAAKLNEALQKAKAVVAG